MPSVQCPRCGLYHPESAQRCDCGYDFASGEVKTPLSGHRGRQAILEIKASQYPAHGASYGRHSGLLLSLLVSLEANTTSIA